jgi:hypothetical protein
MAEKSPHSMEVSIGKIISKWVIVHCHVSLPTGNSHCTIVIGEIPILVGEVPKHQPDHHRNAHEIYPLVI